MVFRFGAVRFFFFQAEDGMRDFCLSRELGDVYKRQVGSVRFGPVRFGVKPVRFGSARFAWHCYDSVSYTHLTLPRILRLVRFVGVVSVNRSVRVCVQVTELGGVWRVVGTVAIG